MEAAGSRNHRSRRLHQFSSLHLRVLRPGSRIFRVTPRSVVVDSHWNQHRHSFTPLEARALERTDYVVDVLAVK